MVSDINILNGDERAVRFRDGRVDRWNIDESTNLRVQMYAARRSLNLGTWYPLGVSRNSR